MRNKHKLLAILTFILGVAIAASVQQPLMELVIDLFQLTTGNKISFHVKNFFWFPSVYYYVLAGVIFTIHYLMKRQVTLREGIRFAILELIIFFVALIGICSVYANLMLAQCTACQDGTRQIRANEINHDFIVITSLVITLIPIVIKRIRSKVFQTIHP